MIFAYSVDRFEPLSHQDAKFHEVHLVCLRDFVPWWFKGF